MPRSKHASFVRDSVFRIGVRPQICEKTPDPATPIRRTNVSLTEDEMDWLDCRCCDIRRNGWRGVSRSSLIRALIEATRSKPLDLTGVSGNADLVEALRHHLSETKARGI